MNINIKVDYRQRAIDYLKNVNHNLRNPLQQEQFIHTCEVNELDPYNKDIYLYGSTYVVSYDAYIKRADTQPKRAGELFETNFNEQGELVSVKCIVRKLNDKGIPYDFLTFEAFLNEFTTNQNLWKTKPTVMLRKCAHVNALRQAYPTLWKSVVYTEDELGKGTEIDNATGAVNDDSLVQKENNLVAMIHQSMQTKEVVPEAEPIIKETKVIKKNTLPKQPDIIEDVDMFANQPVEKNLNEIFKELVKGLANKDKASGNNFYLTKATEYFEQEYGLGFMKPAEFDKQKPVVQQKIIDDLNKIDNMNPMPWVDDLE